MDVLKIPTATDTVTVAAAAAATILAPAGKLHFNHDLQMTLPTAAPEDLTLSCSGPCNTNLQQE
jgi:hypothetical protein